MTEPSGASRARDAAIRALSREIAFVASRSGEVVWVDAGAARLLRLSPGDDLLARTREPEVARALLSRAGDGTLVDVTLELESGNGPLSLVVSAAPDTETRDAVLVVGRVETSPLARELSDSNRGLRVLHAELDEQNAALRRASDVKARVVASVSHEFRTPLHTILGLTRLLLDHVDGELTEEQETQVRFVRDAAETLSQLVEDILDLSRLEAGKAALRVQRFTLGELFAGLRAVMNDGTPGGVSLTFEEEPGIELLETDQGKLSQVLRNLIGNALKFTERGEVRVTARRIREDGADDVLVCVRDTGIGIPEEHLETIFDEFSQIDSPLQARVRGTGLGLALVRRLVTLLGGTVRVDSRPGRGSSFEVRIPRVHDDVRTMEALMARAEHVDPQRAPVLVVEDDRTTMFLYERYLRETGFQVLPARTVEDARAILARVRPAAILLDVMLEGESTWRFLEALKDDEATRSIPVLVVTVVDAREKARALGADDFWLKPVDPRRLRDKLSSITQRTGKAAKILVIDDDETSRYVVKKLLEDTDYRVLEAGSAREGLEIARSQRPELVLLDFTLRDENVFDVLDDLKQDMSTRAIPVVIHTARDLDDRERARIGRSAAGIVPKLGMSRELAIARIREALVAHGVVPGGNEAAR